MSKKTNANCICSRYKSEPPSEGAARPLKGIDFEKVVCAMRQTLPHLKLTELCKKNFVCREKNHFDFHQLFIPRGKVFKYTNNRDA